MQKSMRILNRIISSKFNPKPHYIPNTSILNSSLSSRFSKSIFSLCSNNPGLHSNNLKHPNHGNFFSWHRASAPLTEGKAVAAVVILGWLGATPKHLRSYAELYTTRGIDAVTFVVPVTDVLRFDSGNKVENRIRELADEIVSWLSEAEGRDRCLIFHAFSNTGWLVYGAILVRLKDRPDLTERIKGCIVDSGGEPELNPQVWAAGFSAALLKKRYSMILPSSKEIESGNDGNKSNLQDEDVFITEALLQAVLGKVFSFLFKLPDVKKRMLQIISHLSENQPPCPQLYLYSTADKVIPYRSVESFIEHQKMKGKSVRSFNFGTSPHVDHYRRFHDVYTSLVNSFYKSHFK